MKLETWHIQGQAFHFGKHGIGQEESAVIFHSDSLFAALIALLAQTEQGNLVPQFMEKLNHKPPAFILSSAFPRVGTVRFYPIPRSIISRDQHAIAQAGLTGKSLKNIQFVSELIFLALIQGQSLATLIKNAVQLQNGKLLSSATERQNLPAHIRRSLLIWDQGSGDSRNHHLLQAHIRRSLMIWDEEQRPRVTLDRLTQSSNLYHTGAVHFAPECGLWFALKWNNPDPNLKKIVHNLIQLLADAGLGGERSSGFGQAKITRGDELSLPEMETDAAWVTLSRYIPAVDELPALLNEHSAYQLDRVTGWAESTSAPAERRRTTQMLTEGSVFGPLQNPDPGEIVDVRPVYNGSTTFPHPIYRSGLALAVAIKEIGGTA